MSGSTELFTKETVEKATEKSSRVLHDEAIRKAVFLDNPSNKSTKRLQFPQSSHHQQTLKRLGQQSTGKSSGRSSSSTSFSGYKTSSSSSRHGWGKKF